jgi:hypothetical protein
MSASAHSFVVPAYGLSPHLPACLASLQAQTVPSRIVVTTSTPSADLTRITADAGVELIVNPVARGAAADWTFALHAAPTPWATLAHQDDLYRPPYTERCLAAAAAAPDSLLVFTDYAEETEAGIREHTLNLRIKRVLLAPFFLGRRSIRGPRLRRQLLAQGCPIPCPTGMFNRERLSAFRFDPAFTINMDWDAWLRLAGQPGAFTLVRERLVIHRIHEASETTAGLSMGRRQEEDLRIFASIWPRPIAALLARVYARSYASNRV